MMMMPSSSPRKCKYCIDSKGNRQYREAGFGDNLDWLIKNCCECDLE